MTKWLLLVVMVMVAWPREAGSVFPASRYTHVVPSGVYMKADMNNLGSEVTGIESIFDATTLAGPPLNNGILIGNGTVFKVDALPTGCTASNSALYYDDTTKDVLCHNIASGAFDATATTNLIWSNGAPSLDWRFDVTGSTDPHLVVSPSLSQFNNGSFIITSGPTPIAPDAVLHVDSDNQATMALDSHYNVDNTHSATIYGRRSRGTHAAMSGVVANDNLMTVTPMGRDSTAAWGFAGALEWSASENWTGTAHGTNMILYSIRNGTTASVPAMTVGGTGDVVFPKSVTLDNQAALRLAEPSGAGPQVTGWVAPATLGADRIYTMPSNTPTEGQVLGWHASNLLSWDNEGTNSLGTNQLTYTIDQDLLTGTEPANGAGISFAGNGTVSLTWSAFDNTIAFGSSVTNTKVAFPDPGSDLRTLVMQNNATTCPLPTGAATALCAIGGNWYTRNPSDTSTPYKILSTNIGGVGDFTCSAGNCTINNNTITPAKLAYPFAIADGNLVSYAAVNPNTTTEGLILPQATSCTGATAQGQTCWNTATKTLCVGDGTTCVATTLPGSIKKAIVWRAEELDIASGCTRSGTEGTQINGGPVLRSIICTDTATDTIYGRTYMPANWDQGAVRIILQGFSTNTTPADTLGFDVSCMLRGDDEVINATWGSSQAVNLVFTVQNRTEMVASTDITCNPGTGGAGRTLYWRAVVNITPTTGTLTNVRVSGAVLAYNASYADEVVFGTTTSTTTTTTTTSTTTTTIGFAGDWTDNMIAVWKLNETGIATTGAVNAQGNTAYNLNNIQGTPLLDTTNFILDGGTNGSMSVSGSASPVGVRRADNALATPTVPFTWGCWARATDAVNTDFTSELLAGVWTYGGGGYYIDFTPFNARYQACGHRNTAGGNGTLCSGGGGSQVPTTPPIATPQWAHVVGQMQSTSAIQLFFNANAIGAQTGTTLYDANAGEWFNLGAASTFSRNFVGQLDECFLSAGAITAGSICRICACGIDGKQCTCNAGNPLTYDTTGRKVGACNNCDLSTIDCNQAAPE